MAIKLPIYMDYNATTPVDPRVLDAMMPYLTEHFGNAASSDHAFGLRARDAVENARVQIAEIIDAEAKSIVFTSGATESINLAIKGIAESHKKKGNHIITCTTEHKAVGDTCGWLGKNGYDVTFLKPDEYGCVTADQVAGAITDKTILITIMAANNEIGTIHQTAKIGRVARDHDVIYHCDATQAVGKIPVNVDEMEIDLLSMSGHKLYGPKGVGCLYIRPKFPLTCQMHGGGHERMMRSGTLNVPGIVGFGKAAEICMNEMSDESSRIRELRDRLHEGIISRIDYVKLNGHRENRLPNTLDMSFAFIEGEAVMMAVWDVAAVSSGSACTSAKLKHSYVLDAIGVPQVLSSGSIRFSIGRFTTREEIDYVVEHLPARLQRLRDLSPLQEMVLAGKDIGMDINLIKWERQS